MTLATRRVAVAALCVVAVVLAALMFPATGFGSVPAGPTGPGSADGRGASGPADASDASGPADPGAPGATDGRGTASGAGANAPTAAGTADSGDAGGGPGAATRTPTPTPTAAGGGGTGGDGAGGADGSDDSGTGIVLGAIFWQLLAVTTVGVLSVAGAAEGKSRGWPGFRRLPVPAVSVADVARSTSQASMSFLVRLSASVPRLVSGLTTAADGGTRALSVALSEAGRGLGALAVSLPRGIGRSLLSAPAGLFSFRSRVGRLPTGGHGERAATDHTVDAGSGKAEERVDDEEPSTVAEAWLAMVDRLPVGRETKTPAELARVAVDRGLPAEPVHALTDAFRRVTYGNVPATDDRTETALAALERIERALEGDE